MPRMGVSIEAILRRLLTTTGDIVYASAVNTPARLALGAALQGLRVNAGGTSLEYAAAAAGALTREGGNTTEVTSTSTGVVNLITVSGLSIARPIQIIYSFRKTTGAADYASFGINLNTLIVLTVKQATSATNQAEPGIFWLRCPQSVTNYDLAGFMVLSNYFHTANPVLRAAEDTIPTTITSVTARGNVQNNLITMGTDELHVYSYAVS